MPSRRDTPPQPVDAELIWGSVFCWLMLAVSMLPVGQGVAAVMTGGGWVWPGQGLLASVGGLFSGHVGRGLPAGLARRVPAGWVVYTAIVVCELGLVAATVGGWLAWRMLATENGGMASRYDAEKALGVSLMHRRRREIRPDLYGGQPQPVDDVAYTEDPQRW